MEAKEYWEEIRSLADEFAKVVEAEGVGSEAAREWLHETIDGHEFVIYTHKAKYVGIHTDNPDAALDMFGPEGLVRDGNINYEAMAYCSMEADILAAVELPS